MNISGHLMSSRPWTTLVGVSVLLVGLDFLTGPYILFPITFVLPVSLAGWWLGRWSAVGFAVVLASARFGLVVVWGTPEVSVAVGFINALIRLLVLVGLGVMVDLISQQYRQLQRRVQTLEGLLPICALCKKIRCEDGTWEPIEAYVTKRSQAQFSHGFCRPCAVHHYPAAFESPPEPRN